MTRLGTSHPDTRRRPPGAETLPVAAGTSAWYGPVSAAADALGVLLPVLCVYTLGQEPRPLAVAVGAAVSWVVLRAVHRRYGVRTLGETRGLLAVGHDWLLLLGVLAVGREITKESAPVLTLLLAVCPALLVTGATEVLIHRHLVWRRRRAEAGAVRRVLVVGEAPTVDTVAAQLAAGTDHPYVLVGAVPVGRGALSCGVPEAGRLAAAAQPWPLDGPELAVETAEGRVVLEAARRHATDLVLVAPGALLTGARLRRLLWAVQDAGLALTVASGLAEVAPHRVRPTVAAGLHLLHLSPPLRRGPQPAVKAVLDRVCATLGLALLAPLLAVLALAVRLDSPGPVLFRQTRVGRHGVPFTLWKFRSMVADAEVLRPGLESANEHGGGPLFKLRRDPRVTRVGQVLRRWSLDELPQLVNVVRGEMSLVGPRPALPGEVARYGPTAMRRLAVKPGLTGPWQVGGRSELSWDEGLALDLSYADNWSLTTDMDVLARTVRAVVDGRGAY